MKFWRKFVRWLAWQELNSQADFYEHHLREYETSWRHTTEALKTERDVYKKRYEYIISLQADELLTRPIGPIIIRKDELGLGSSAAEVAAKQKDKEA